MMNRTGLLERIAPMMDAEPSGLDRMDGVGAASPGFCYQCGQAPDDMGPAFRDFHDQGHHRMPQPRELRYAAEEAMDSPEGRAVAAALGYVTGGELVRALAGAEWRAGLRAARY